MPQQRVGVIGLGSMGRGIGKNLVTKGFPLTVYDANLAAIEPLQLLGAEGAETPRAVAERSDVVITVLPNGPDVEAVALGPNGIAEGAKPGTIVMDCSTIDPAVSLSINQRLRERGIRMADTAMGRGSGEAEAGTLVFMVGAEPEDFAAIRPILEATGSDVFHVGPPGPRHHPQAGAQPALADDAGRQRGGDGAGRQGRPGPEQDAGGAPGQHHRPRAHARHHPEPGADRRLHAGLPDGARPEGPPTRPQPRRQPGRAAPDAGDLAGAVHRDYRKGARGLVERRSRHRAGGDRRDPPGRPRPVPARQFKADSASRPHARRSAGPWRSSRCVLGAWRGDTSGSAGGC